MGGDIILPSELQTAVVANDIEIKNTFPSFAFFGFNYDTIQLKNTGIDANISVYGTIFMKIPEFLGGDPGCNAYAEFYSVPYTQGEIASGELRSVDIIYGNLNSIFTLFYPHRLDIHAQFGARRVVEPVFFYVGIPERIIPHRGSSITGIFASMEESGLKSVTRSHVLQATDLAEILPEVSLITEGIIDSTVEEITAQFTVPSNTENVIFLLVVPQGKDIDMHVYGENGAHVGYNYLTGDTDTEILNSGYSGKNGSETVFVGENDEPGYEIDGKQFQIVIRNIASIDKSSVKVYAMSIPERDAIMTVLPSEIKEETTIQNDQFYLEIPFCILETGGQKSLQDMSTSISDLVGPSNTIPSGRILVDNQFIDEVCPGCAAEITIKIPIDSTMEETYKGNITITSNAGTVTLPITLIVNKSAASTSIADTAPIYNFLMRPLARHRISQANSLKEKAQLLLEEAAKKELDISEAQFLINKADDLLENAEKLYLSGNYISANNFALQAIDFYEQTIEILRILIG